MTMDSDNSKVSRRGFLSAVGSGVVLAATAKAATAPAYPLVRAAGSPRELGRQHGEQVGEKIKAHVAMITADDGHSRDQQRDRALAFRPLFERYCPHLLEEIQGLAEGARVSLAEALAVNIQMHIAPPPGCTSFVVGRTGTSQHQILAGKNCDMVPGYIPMGYVLHLKPQNKPAVLMWTFGGMIGYHGMNSAGVTELDNALFGDGPPTQWGKGMPIFPLKRLMLECDHVDQMVQLYKTIPMGMNCNYIVCDGHGNILDLETTTAGTEILRDRGAGFLAHANHYHWPRYPGVKTFPPDWKDSFHRQERMDAMIRAKVGSITLGDAKKFLSDHSGYPTSICRHTQTHHTIASMVVEPEERRLHVSLGNPCENSYVAYSV